MDTFTITAQVTRDRIVGGKKNCRRTCPIAKAVIAALPEPIKAEVDAGRLVVMTGYYTTILQEVVGPHVNAVWQGVHPESAQDFVRAFDDNDGVIPFEFPLTFTRLSQP